AAMPIDIYTESRINPLASLSRFGSTTAIGYVNAATGATVWIIAMNTPIRPYASGPYRRVIMGVNASEIAWAAAVPEAMMTTLRTNGDRKSTRLNSSHVSI